MWEYRHTDELYHYGILGMKWGVRRARKRAAKENVKGRSQYSTGKHFDSVHKKVKKEWAPIEKKFSKSFDKLVEDGNKYNAKIITTGKYDPKERQKLSDRNAKLLRDYNAARMKIAKKYVDQFNEATLKDINYKDIEKGKRKLSKLREGNVIYTYEL